MTELDVPSDRDQNVSIIQLQNGDPQQVAQVLQNMFGSSSTSRSGTQFVAKQRAPATRSKRHDHHGHDHHQQRNRRHRNGSGGRGGGGVAADFNTR